MRSCNDIINEILPLLEALANCGCQTNGSSDKSLKELLNLKPSKALIKDTNLNIIEQAILAEGGINTVKDLVNKTEADLLKLRRMNYRALADIEHALLGRPESPSWTELTRTIEQRHQ